MFPRNPVPVWLMHVLLIGAAVLSSAPLRARSAPAEGPAQMLKIYLERATTGLPGRVEVNVGTLDERVKLAPCNQVEPYIPRGSRLWGRSSIGLRCHDAAGWNVFLPVDIRVYAKALIASRSIGTGQIPGDADVREEEIDLTRESGVLVSQLVQLAGKTTARPLAAGQILKQEYFRAPAAVDAGDTVRVQFIGAGFAISTSGRALSQAAEGQSVRVQTDTGRFLQGIARNGRIVELR